MYGIVIFEPCRYPSVFGGFSKIANLEGIGLIRGSCRYAEVTFPGTRF